MDFVSSRFIIMMSAKCFVVLMILFFIWCIIPESYDSLPSPTIVKGKSNSLDIVFLIGTIISETEAMELKERLPMVIEEIRRSGYDDTRIAIVDTPKKLPLFNNYAYEEEKFNLSSKHSYSVEELLIQSTKLDWNVNARKIVVWVAGSKRQYLSMKFLPLIKEIQLEMHGIVKRSTIDDDMMQYVGETEGTIVHISDIHKLARNIEESKVVSPNMIFFLHNINIQLGEN